MPEETAPSSERRSFLSRVNTGFAAVAALATGGAAIAQEKAAPATRFEPARHDKDDWMDQLPGKHRLVFDTTSADGLSEALLFGNNFIRVNRVDYGLANNELAVIVVVRHRSAPFGLNDAMWAKYGKYLAEHAAYSDPKTKEPPKLNVLNSTEYGNAGPNRGTVLDALSKQGVQFAVCTSATQAVAGAIARATGGERDAVYKELTANLIANARMVPAGIVAVSRAQERGYTLVTA